MSSCQGSGATSTARLQEVAGSSPASSIGSTLVSVAETVDALILDLLEWMGPEPRPYEEVIEAWRTSCPRLTVWEDAHDLGFIERLRSPNRGLLVCVSAAGAEHLRQHRRSAQPTR
jgi:hypothetical protein